MKAAVTIRLDEDIERRLDQVCQRSGKTRSEVVRDSLRRQLSLMQLEQTRARVLPFAEAQGLLTDEDVFRLIS
jgi:predicted transcriptional regulator